MSKTKPIVHLRVYKSSGVGNGISYDANGKIQNENILVKLTHDTLEWYNYLKFIKAQGFIKAIVEKAVVFSTSKKGETSSNEIKDLSKIKNEVVKAMSGEKRKLTPDQERIAKLEEQLKDSGVDLGEKTDNSEKDAEIAQLKEELAEKNALLAEKSNNADNSNKVNETDPLEKARSEYKEKVDKKPHPSWNVETIEEKLAEHLAK